MSMTNLKWHSGPRVRDGLDDVKTKTLREGLRFIGR